MRRMMMLAVTIALLPVPANAVDPGEYYCVVKDMIGIWPERELTQSELNYDEDPYAVPRTTGPVVPDGTDQYLEEIERVARQIAVERGLDPNNVTKAQAKEITDLAMQRTWVEAPAGKHFILRVSKFSAGIDDWCIASRLNPDIVSTQCDPLARYRAELPINQLTPPGDESQTEISPLGHEGYLASPDGRTFYGRQSMLHFEVNRFQMVQLQGSSGGYLAEGTCYPQ